MRLILFKYYNFSSLLIKIFCIDFVLVYIKTTKIGSTVPRSRDYIGDKLSVDIGTIKSNYCEVLSRFFGLTASNKTKANKNVLYHLVNIICFCIISATANAQTTYYVSNTGSDSANGTSTASPFRTTAKAMTLATVPGSQILHKAGDTFNVSLRNFTSGSSTQSIKFGAYGTGPKPVITGFQTINTFSNIGGNIWRATVPQVSKTLNTVLIDGIIRAKGRSPNVGYTPTSSNGTTTQINTTLTGDYTGYFIANRPQRWIIDISKITAQTGGALTVSPALTANSSNGYFLQNHVNLLDTLGEWAHDSANNYLYVYSPTSPNVKASTIDTLVYLNNKSNIIFDGIEFSGANVYGIHVNTGSNIVVSNCTINNIGGRGFLAYNVNNTTFLNDTITNALSNGFFADADTNTTVTNCWIKNIGHLAGMGRSGNGNYIGIYSQGPNAHFNLNRLDSCGYIGIRFQGTNNKVDSNYVTNWGFIKDDGGAIYTFSDYYTNSIGSRIRGNITINGIGAPLSNADQSPQAYGIYLDLNSTGITVENNTVDSATHAGLFSTGSLNSYLNNTVRGGADNNVIYNTDVQQTIKGNIFYKTATSYQTYIAYYTVVDNTSHVDSNYYLIPSGNAVLSVSRSAVYPTLATWQSASSQDAHSSSTFPGNSTSGTLLYNPTLANKTVSISGYYIDVYGNQYSSTITIPPFQSRLIFPTDAFVIPPIKFRSRFRNLKL